MTADAGGPVLLLAAALSASALVLWRRPVPRGRLSTPPSSPRSGAPATATGDVTAAAVAALADRVAAAVEAGLPLRSAWLHATGGVTSLRVTSADPVDRSAAAGLSAALRLAEDRGLPPSAVLRAVAEAARDVRAADAARVAATAGPLAAARIVAGLPLAGPLVAAMLGVDPVAVLLGTSWGRVCLVLGLAFVVTAAWWSRELVRRARAEARAGT